MFSPPNKFSPKACIGQILTLTSWASILHGFLPPHQIRFVSSGSIVHPGTWSVGNGMLESFKSKNFNFFMKYQQGALVKTLEQEPNLPVPKGERQFLINGWRWHSRSVLRDLQRFEKMLTSAKTHFKAKHSSTATSERREIGDRLCKAHTFLWGFSWAALNKIEVELFFPWLKKQLPGETHTSLGDLELEKQQIILLGKRLASICKEISATGLEPDLDHAVVLTQEIYERTSTVVHRQEAFIVAFVSAYVPFKDQKKFNDKVLMSLGLVNAQVHLVSMADAVEDDSSEKEKFKKQIPSVAQAMIPVWRRSLYNPKAKYLEETVLHETVIK